MVLLSALETWTMRILGTYWNLSDIGLVLFLIAAIVRLFLSRDRIDPLVALFAAVAMTAWLSALFSLDQLSAANSALRFSADLTLAYFIAHTLSKAKRLDWGLRAFYSAASVTLLITLWQYMTWGSSPALHFRGGFHDWNLMPIFLAAVVPFIFYEIRRTKQPIAWIGFLYLTLLTALSAHSHGGTLLAVLAIVLSFAAGILKKNDWKWLLPLAIVALLYGWRNAGPDSFPIAFSRWIENGHFQDRIQSGLLSLMVWVKHPLLGVGPGQIETYIEWSHPGMESGILSAGSSLFVIPAEMGLLGCLLFAGIFGLLLFKFKTLNDREPLEDDRRRLLKACWVSTAILALSFALYTIHIHRIAWCLIGLYLGAMQNFSQQESEPE